MSPASDVRDSRSLIRADSNYTQAERCGSAGRPQFRMVETQTA
jgi:hypothetical protein